MISVIKKNECCGCGSCKQICPVNAIEMKEDAEGFLYPEVSKDICIQCNKCEISCPIISKKLVENKVRIAFAARTKSNDVLRKSTSGGVSFELAKNIIKAGGAVVGACYGRGNVVEHRVITSLQELEQIQGSKYVQSSLLNTFKQVEVLLQNGKPVLYTGTTCQIEGLLAFLGKAYDNLFTQDLICHGVPSPGLWKKYLKENHWENAEAIVFRDKAKGWEIKSEFAVINGKKEIRMPFNKNPYYHFFGQNYSLRPICYECPFKNDNRKSDFTVADLWGIAELLPAEMNDDRGWSLLLVHTQKGLEMVKSISEQLNFKEIDYDKAVSKNMMMLLSVKPSEGRNRFFTDIKVHSFKRLYKKYKPKLPPILAIKTALYPIKEKLFGK